MLPKPVAECGQQFLPESPVDLKYVSQVIVDQRNISLVSITTDFIFLYFSGSVTLHLHSLLSVRPVYLLSLAVFYFFV